MALQSSRMREVPEDSVVLTKSNAAKYQIHLMNLFSEPGDRFFVGYGKNIAGNLSILSAFAIHFFYRGIFKVKEVARISTFMISTAVPGYVNLFLHKEIITNDIVVQKWACPYCYHLRSAFLQVLFGIAWPVAFCAVSSPILARKTNAVEGVPPLNHFKEFFKFVNDKTKHGSRNGLLLMMINCAAGVALANMQVNESNWFNENFEKLVLKHHQEQTKEKM